MIFSIVIPIKTVTEGNAKEHWHAKANRAKKQREAIRDNCFWHCFNAGLLVWDKARGRFALPADTPQLVATFTRIAPGAGLDVHDNLPGSQKHTIDSFADLLGIDDGGARVIWRYAQERGPRGFYGVRVTVAYADVEAA